MLGKLWEAVGTVTSIPLANSAALCALMPSTNSSTVEVDAVRERRLAKFRQSVARFRLYRLRFLQENMRFAAFFKIYQIIKLKCLKLILARFCKFCDICNCFAEISRKLLFFQKKKIKPIFCENFEIAAVQKDANLVELEKCCHTHIFLQNLISFWYSRERARQKFANFRKMHFSKMHFRKANNFANFANPIPLTLSP